MGISEQLNNFISQLSVIPPGCCTVVVPSLLKKLVPLPHLAFQRPSHPRHLWFCFGYLVGNIGVHCFVYTSFKKSPVFIHASSLAFVKEILLCINHVFMKAIHVCTLVDDFRGFVFMVKVTMSWSLIPGTTLTSDIRVGVDERTKSGVFKDTGRVGSVTC